MSDRSRPVYTSKLGGFRSAEEIAALRPQRNQVSKGRVDRPVLREVTSGIVCFCGERFGESESLDFMLHLRAEVGEILEWRERKREILRRHQHTEKHRAYNREWKRAKRAERDPVDAPHGTTNGYNDWGCRCEFCSQAARAYRTAVVKCPYCQIDLQRQSLPKHKRRKHSERIGDRIPAVAQ